MSARFRPAFNPSPRALTFRSDPPLGMRPSTYYAAMILAVPKTVAVLVKANMWALIRDDLGSAEAAAEWLAALVKRRGSPIMLHVGDRTLAVGSGTTEQLFGHIGVHHEILEQEFGPIERVA